MAVAKRTRKKTSRASSSQVQERIKAIGGKQTRSEIFQALAEETNMKRAQIEAVFDALGKLVKGHMKRRGSGEFMIPKLGVKIKRVRRKSTKKRKMVSPLTGMEVTIPAKPARDDIKLIALKTLKETIGA